MQVLDIGAIINNNLFGKREDVFTMAKDKKVEQITDMEVDFTQWFTDVCKKAQLIDYCLGHHGRQRKAGRAVLHPSHF